MSVIQRNNVRSIGRGTQPMVFAHGYGCDQNMWRYVTPAFEAGYRIVLFDHVGCGRSDLLAFNRMKYSDLNGYAVDVLEICRELELRDVILVAHSVSSMIAMLAAIQEPARFAKLVLICPSPCYLNQPDYQGGFERQDLDALLEFMDSNFLGWAGAMAPQIMGNTERPDLGEELTNSFCSTDPEIAKHFARVTFLSDNRADLPKLRVPSLILQCADDIIAPITVGQYVQRHVPQSRLTVMAATGHCPNLSAPEETVAAIKAFL